jgi:hypothetical protein
MNSKKQSGNLSILSQHYDRRNRPNPHTEETGKTKLDEMATTDNKILNDIPKDKLQRLEAICNRLSPRSAVIAEILPAPTISKALNDFCTRSADVIAVSLPDPKALDDFYKSQEADRKIIEELNKEFERLKIETAEISKSLELQAEDTGNNGQVLTPSSNKPIKSGNDTGKGKRNEQIDLICSTAEFFGYNLLSIPKGGRAKIKTKCLKNALFTDSGFKRAWQKANELNKISMQDKAQYL